MSKRSMRRQRARMQPQPAVKQEVAVSNRAWLDALRVAAGPRQPEAKFAPFAPARHPECVQPAKAVAMAMDENMPVAQVGGEFIDGTLGSYLWGGEHFLGFGMLALLAQKPEIRRMYEVLASEMTRKGIKFQSSGDDDKGEKIKQIEGAFRDFRVMDLMRRVAEGDGCMGRGHIYVDLGSEDPKELATPIGSGCDAASKAKVAQGGLKGLRTVEAMWCYPSGYNSSNPLHPHWYRPQQWIIPGQTVHASRLLTFVGREVPDVLKPAYSFGGLSLSQMALPYVENWTRTRKSIADLINAFSVMVLSTPMGNLLASGGDQLAQRIMDFVTLRTNRGVMVVDKDKEDLKNVSAPLGGLEALQAQTQEHMAAVCGIPLVKLLGITPTGLNASSEGEIRVFYDWIHAYQETLFRPNLQAILGFVQLHLFGEVDPEISFSFEPLWSMSDKELAEVRKTEAETAQVYADTGVITPAEERKRLADDPESMYHGLDPDEVPDLQAEAEEGLEPGGEGGSESLLGRAAEGEPTEETKALDELFDRARLARDDWRESDHPRAENGQFGSGGSSGSSEADEPDDDEDDDSDEDDEGDDLETPSYDLHSDEIVEPSDDDEESEAKIKAAVAKHDPAKIVLHAPLQFDEDGEIDRVATHEALMSSLDTHRNAPGFLSDEAKEHDDVRAHNAALDYLEQFGEHFDKSQAGHNLVLAFERGEDSPYYAERQQTEERLREEGHDDASIEREISGEADAQRKADASRQRKKESRQRYKSTDATLSEEYPGGMEMIEAARRRRDFRTVQVLRSKLIQRYEADHGVKLSYDAKPSRGRGRRVS